MSISPAAVHRTIVFVDVEKFSAVGTLLDQLAVRAGLRAVMAKAFGTAGIPWSACHVEDRGDGLLIVGPGESKAPYVESLPGAVARELRTHNTHSPAESRFRLRMVVHAGELSFDKAGCTGNAVVRAARLLDAAPVKAALAASSGVLVVVVSQWFYDEIVSQSAVLDTGRYRRVTIRVKETETTGWVCLPDNPYPALRSTARKVPAAALGVVALLLVTGLAGDARFDTTERIIGGDYPAESEFVAKVINQRSGKCLSRNGIYSQDDENDAEYIGAGVYQWECAESDDEPGHTVVLAPQQAGWAIRSSIKLDLCLAADGAPGQSQRFQACKPHDGRQRWRLRQVFDQVRDVVAIENENTKQCLAFTDPDPKSISLVQAACLPGKAFEWEVRRYPGIGEQVCAERPAQRLRNHESGDHLDVTLSTAPRSAHGCTSVVTDPSGRCLTLASGVRWLACTRQPDQQWVIEPMGEEGGRRWSRFHSAADLSRCLQPDDTTSLTVRRCDSSWQQQWSHPST
ncbi:ricin-type beta-trefoil lectin domain protein [Amycolatopsis sp. 195334CR]|uniref:ricin-type beta-trefoil lectin domain protein n=1 Tax=Amycolatopsis sp. 195334CR TaxID=2814588 RepID=UPI001A8F68FB|nr:ricin-type beta-trefoil lectin domain protein [Amycolatopsis sp. 195334CR]MBN6037601.1 ricin-type beta-trefoil lectin domain protein [Amycolatopsis sp. 195334CR]